MIVLCQTLSEEERQAAIELAEEYWPGTGFVLMDTQYRPAVVLGHVFQSPFDGPAAFARQVVALL